VEARRTAATQAFETQVSVLEASAQLGPSAVTATSLRKRALNPVLAWMLLIGSWVIAGVAAWTRFHA